MEVTNLLDIHTRKELYRWYERNHDKVSDFWLRINRAEADKQAWKHWQSFPEVYKRIKADRIQHYQHTNRPEYAQKTLEKLIQDTHNGKLQSGWNDFGRLNIFAN